jgi:hypothetical protein
MSDTEPSINIERTNVPLVRAVAIIVAIAGGSWWIGSYMERMGNRMSNLEAQVSQLSKEVANLAQRVAYR